MIDSYPDIVHVKLKLLIIHIQVITQGGSNYPNIFKGMIGRWYIVHKCYRVDKHLQSQGFMHTLISSNVREDSIDKPEEIRVQQPLG